MKYFTSTSPKRAELCAAAIAIIDNNCGFPNNRGTKTWAIPYEIFGGGKMVFPKPFEQGRVDDPDYFTQEQMLAGFDFSIFLVEEYNLDWFPLEKEVV